MTIVNRVKQVREQAGMTQQQLADAAGVSRQTVIAIEKGNYVPSLLLAMQIAKYFKMSVEDIFTIKH